MGALTLPIVILFTFGDMDTDRFRRQQDGGVTLQGRAVNDFKRGLTKENFDRVLLRLGVKKAEPPPTAARDAAAAAGEAAATARSELECVPRPSPRPHPRRRPRAICTAVRVSPPHVLGRRLRSNQAAVTNPAAVGEQEEKTPVEWG